MSEEPSKPLRRLLAAVALAGGLRERRDPLARVGRVEPSDPEDEPGWQPQPLEPTARRGDRPEHGRGRLGDHVDVVDAEEARGVVGDGQEVRVAVARV